VTGQVRLASAQDMAAVYALRYGVFVGEQAVPEELERDELDEAADHVVALRDGVVIGTGRLVDGRIDVDGRLEPGSLGAIGTIGRMAVSASARGIGTGRALLDRLVERAGERGLPAVELHAQVHARVFYQRAGFSAFGDVYLEAGIEHVGMRRDLQAAPADR
jgi:predicted GNAT family N-acyltransferase